MEQTPSKRLVLKKRASASPTTDTKANGETKPLISTKKSSNKPTAAVGPPPRPTHIPGLGREQGPASIPVPNYQGRTMLADKRGPHVIIIETAGAFRYLWEMVEARAHADYLKYNATSPVAADAVEVVKAFRAAADKSYRPLFVEPPKTKSKSKAEPAPAKKKVVKKK